MANGLLLRPDAVFTGSGTAHRDWAVLVNGDRIAAVGPAAEIAATPNVVPIALPGTTLLPGLMDLHAHLLLHPYDRIAWDVQVLREPAALRVARATVAARATLRAGFTLVRDLGSEGAGFADVGLREAIERGIVPGPRMLVATKAIVATGSYGPKGFAPECGCLPLGAQEADGVDALTRVVREQIGRGADWIKIYADIAWGPAGESRPTFTLDELKLVVEVAESSGRHVAAHATTAEGMRRATLAGVRTVEHGDDGTPEVFALMAERGVALCPTIAAYEAIIAYGKHGLGGEPYTPDPQAKYASMRAAIAAGVTIVSGSDAGVYPHGDNARELEALVRYGLSPQQALEAATSSAARILDLSDRLGAIVPGARADLVAVGGDPLADIGALRDVRLVVRAGAVFDDDTR